MIRQIYRLTDVRQFELCQVETEAEGLALIRPRYLSICAADQRYYLGNRNPEVMRKKLPMSLIHEASGVVLRDPSGRFNSGDTVVLVPNIRDDSDTRVRENYQQHAIFRSSGRDGFMQSLVPMPIDRLVRVRPELLRLSVLCELLSVAFCAVKTFLAQTSVRNGDVIGVWGDGSVGFMVALVLKVLCQETNIVVMGKSVSKMRHFTFADTSYRGSVHHAFECVGGGHSEAAIDEIIDRIHPQGSINLLGVSETKVSINTRLLLEKGLSAIGHSRSSIQDFQDAAALIEDNARVRGYLASVISEEVPVNHLADIHHAFDSDLNNDFKTILEWNV